MSLKIKLSLIPETPGCYLFKDEKEKIIYVGKSKYLPNRVMSYFRPNPIELKTKSLLERIKDVDFISTINENEAILNYIDQNLMLKVKMTELKNGELVFLVEIFQN